jgi:transposase InsO family protein
MTGDKSYFIQLTEKDMQFNIELGDNGKYQAKGSEIVKFERESGKPLYLRDVLYVPRLKKNLVSVSVLEHKGYEVFFRQGKVFIKPLNSRTPVQLGVRAKTLYRLQFETAAVVSRKDIQQGRELAELWHRRMGHLHHRELKILGEIAIGQPPCSVDHHEVCKGCTLGKYAKTSFPIRDDRAKGVLELIHSDVCGPFSSPSLCGFRYYVIFIDDHSRKTWIFLMKNKDEVLSRFVEFKALVEKQTSKKIKALRSDNGGEYISNAFRGLCSKEGIRRELTTPYNPQQYGVAKRKNRSILGAFKAMLHDQGLPMFLWAEACNTAVFLQNRSLHKVLGKATPEEAFTGKRPDVSHFRIFGSLVHCHVPSESRKKLDPTAAKGIFVGYSETAKAYRVYVSALRRTVIGCDVMFEEGRALKKSLEHEQEAAKDEEQEAQPTHQ